MNESRQLEMPAALRRLRLIAGQTLGEALRLRLTLLLGFVAALLVLGALGLREFNFGTVELKFIADFGVGTIGLLGTLLAALATAHLFFNDLASGAIACVLTRPVRRWEYLAGKLGGVVALLALYTAALGGWLAGLLLWRGGQLGAIPAALPLLPAACALQWMKFTVVAAMTLLVCSYARSALFASFAGLLLAAIGHLRPFAPSGRLEWLRVWPNLGLFDAEAMLASGQPLAGPLPSGVTAYWALCLLLLGVLTCHVFQRREF